MKNYLWIALAGMAAVIVLVGCAQRRENAPEAAETLAPENALIIDVRTPGEFSDGHLENAINVPLQNISSISSVAPDKNTVLYLYCRSGRRVKMAIAELKKLGYNNLHDLGGMQEAAAKLKKNIVK